MRALGVLTSAVGLAVVAVAVVIGIRSAPDIQRYLRIRQM
jgi:hypothetical protein